MAKIRCQGCEREHEDWAWKNTTYTFPDGSRSGWFCTKWHKPRKSAEKVPEHVKQQRIENANDMVQPWRQGEPSKEFIDLYPSEAKKTFTEKEIKKAKNVWKDVKGINTKKK
jgi:hypothetical protein